MDVELPELVRLVGVHVGLLGLLVDLLGVGIKRGMGNGEWEMLCNMIIIELF